MQNCIGQQNFNVWNHLFQRTEINGISTGQIHLHLYGQGSLAPPSAFHMSAWVCTKWQIAQANINRALQNQIAWNFPLNTLPSIEGSLSILFVQSPSQFLLNNDLQGILFWTQISILLILLIFCFPDILEFDSQTVLALPTQGSHIQSLLFLELSFLCHFLKKPFSVDISLKDHLLMAVSMKLSSLRSPLVYSQSIQDTVIIIVLVT